MNTPINRIDQAAAKVREVLAAGDPAGPEITVLWRTLATTQAPTLVTYHDHIVDAVESLPDESQLRMISWLTSNSTGEQGAYWRRFRLPVTVTV